MIKFDDAKSDDEKKIERSSEILSRTIPEQTEDAMSDYTAVLAILRKGKDWRFEPLVKMLEDVYIYPRRSAHNELVSELNDLKETLLEERIQRVLSSKEASKHSQKFLGDNKPASKITLWRVLVVGALAYLLFGRK